MPNTIPLNAPFTTLKDEQMNVIAMLVYQICKSRGKYSLHFEYLGPVVQT